MTTTSTNLRELLYASHFALSQVTSPSRDEKSLELGVSLEPMFQQTDLSSSSCILKEDKSACLKSWLQEQPVFQRFLITSRFHLLLKFSVIWSPSRELLNS
uniref:Uncharacterized protein n=1 Tax=Rhipicephalus zambeziensis TaxID=60191 RepID=A0A224Y718_9ACAR